MNNRTFNRSRGLSIVWVAIALAACAGSGENRGVDGPRADTAGDPMPAEAADYSELRAEVCADLTNSFRCARAIEGRQLPEPGVERRGDTLALALERGDSVRLVDVRGDASEVVHYSYQTRWPERGVVLVQAQYYEGSEYLLVDTTTGERTRLPHWPLLGPDGRRFAVLSFDIEAGYGPNTLQIWEMRSGTPSLEWSVEPEGWGPAEGQWEDASTLRFLKRGYCERDAGPGREMCERPARVVLEQGGWTLVTDG